MKNVRLFIQKQRGRLDGYWRALPVKKQRRCALYFFAGYLLLTVMVIIQVCTGAGKSKKAMVTGHIENPVIRQKKSSALPQDSISITLKNKTDER